MTKYLAALVLITVTSTSHAGIKEIKAKRLADVAIAEASKSMKSACGNVELKVNVDWSTFSEMVSNNIDHVKKRRMNGETIGVYSEAGDRTVAVLNDFESICKNDEDYKGEITKITSISITSKPKYDEYKSTFSLTNDGASLAIETGNHVTRMKGDYEQAVKALY